MEQKNSKFNLLLEQIKKLVSLYYEDFRLTSTEKLTVLLSTIAIFGIVLVFLALFIVLAAMAVAQLLESVMAPFWAYMTVALFFLLSAVLFFAFRTEIIINPVARFLSGLFVAPPVNPSADKQSNSKNDQQL